jgi:hypothetical protein
MKKKAVTADSGAENAESPAPKKKPAKTKAKVVRKVKDTSESVSPS